ncbi:hypothetical protein SR42_00135 [Clostridium botulinum]|nr:hypothetical protein SR42_00135 [Clostridium botulinum]
MLFASSNGPYRSKKGNVIIVKIHSNNIKIIVFDDIFLIFLIYFLNFFYALKSPHYKFLF